MDTPDSDTVFNGWVQPTTGKVLIATYIFNDNTDSKTTCGKHRRFQIITYKEFNDKVLKTI